MSHGHDMLLLFFLLNFFSHRSLTLGSVAVSSPAILYVDSDTGKAFCFGVNRDKLCGRGTANEVIAEPVEYPVPAGSTAVKAFGAISGTNFAVVLDDGSVLLSGRTTNGQLCITATDPPDTPNRVNLPNNEKVAEVAFYNNGSFFRTETGLVYECRGNGMQLISTLTGVKQVVAGFKLQLYLFNDGTVKGRG